MAANREPRFTVLTLHRVGASHGIQLDHVERCLRFLATHFHVIKSSDLVFSRCGRRTAIVTVDDGHVDAYRYVFPVARAVGIPISLCIPTDFFFRKRWLWFDKVTWALHNAGPTATAAIRGFRITGGDTSSFDRFRAHLKRFPPARRDPVIRELLCALDLRLPSSPPEEYRAVSVPELKEMLSSGLVEIVGHTVTHTIATVLDGEDLERELVQSKEEWETFCGQPITSFCYPNGGPGDFSERTASALRKTGYHNAFTSIEGTNIMQTMNPLEMKRVHIHRRAGVCDKLVSGLADIQNALRPRSAEHNGSCLRLPC